MQGKRGIELIGSNIILIAIVLVVLLVVSAIIYNIFKGILLP